MAKIDESGVNTHPLAFLSLKAVLPLLEKLDKTPVPDFDGIAALGDGSCMAVDRMPADNWTESSVGTARGACDFCFSQAIIAGFAALRGLHSLH